MKNMQFSMNDTSNYTIINYDSNAVMNTISGS